MSGDIAGISFSFAWHPSLVRHVLMMRVRGTESEELNEGRKECRTPSRRY